MHIERQYRELEKIEEIRVYNVDSSKFYQESPQVMKPDKVPFSKLMKHVPADIDVFLPVDDGEDFIIERIGWNMLQRANVNPEDVEYRLFSQCSPFFYDLLKDDLKEVYKTGNTKALRIIYYISDRIRTLTNIHIILEEDEIYLISDFKENKPETEISEEEQKLQDNENKANLIEYFSQTGSYYKTRDEYVWTPGIYNIINRSKEPRDAFYNIIFDLVIPEDKPLVEELLETMSPETDTYENIIRISTPGGQIKYLDTYLYSKFDVNGEEISHYGLFKDISVDSHKHMTRPVDFMLNGFNQNSKLSLLVEPLSKRYEFSEGFYKIIEIPKEDYVHNESIIDYIEEEDVREKLKMLINGEIEEINTILTFNVNGNEENQKICELFIERFTYGNKIHSIGFLTDVTIARQKQKELIESNATKNILIKEVHHRVKNNLQVLNSFLNLERRAYGSNPNKIIDNMQARLSSLALLHEKTYNTADFINVNLKDYILDQDETLQNLFTAKDIQFKSYINEEIHLSMEIITPLLLVIDELTMNAIKHAFPNENQEDKTIYKKIDYIDDNVCELILKDITKQINGKIEVLELDVGTGFRLTFPKTFEHEIEGLQ